MIGKLVGLASLGGTVANVALLQRFLAGVTSVIALTIVSGLLAAMLLAGGFFAIYFSLTHYGLAPGAALVAVAALAVAVTAALAGLAAFRFRQLRELPYQHLHPGIPALSRIGGIANAFLDGLTAPTPKPRG